MYRSSMLAKTYKMLLGILLHLPLVFATKVDENLKVTTTLATSHTNHRANFNISTIQLDQTPSNETLNETTKQIFFEQPLTLSEVIDVSDLPSNTFNLTELLELNQISTTSAANYPSSRSADRKLTSDTDEFAEIRSQINPMIHWYQSLREASLTGNVTTISFLMRTVPSSFVDLDNETSAIIQSFTNLRPAHVNGTSQNTLICNASTLLEAVRCNDTARVQHFLDQGVDVNQKQENSGGTTPLILAVMSGSFDIVKQLVKYGANLDATSDSGKTAIIEAAGRGFKVAVEFLAEKGAALGIVDNTGITALLSSALANHADITRFLVGLTAGGEDSVVMMVKNWIFSNQGRLRAMPTACWKDTALRGIGRPIHTCASRGARSDKDAGLCYRPCAEGYTGVGPVCWESSCSENYTDIGALCSRAAKIIGADNSNCPWYDKCGLTFARGCSSCPEHYPSYSNDGCTCRINLNVYAKSSYGRGIGLPLGCDPDSEEYDAGLCYRHCPSDEYDGVGPVCWRKCSKTASNFSTDYGAVCCASRESCNGFVANVFKATANLVGACVEAGFTGALRIPYTISRLIGTGAGVAEAFILPVCTMTNETLRTADDASLAAGNLKRGANVASAITAFIG